MMIEEDSKIRIIFLLDHICCLCFDKGFAVQYFINKKVEMVFFLKGLVI